MAAGARSSVRFWSEFDLPRLKVSEFFYVSRVNTLRFPLSYGAARMTISAEADVFFRGVRE